MRSNSHTVLVALAAAVTLVVAAGLAARPSGLHASRLAGILGAGSSGFTVLNLDAAQSLQADATVYRQGGGRAGNLAVQSIPPLSAYSYYLPSEQPLGPGLYSLLIGVDRAASALVRTEWPQSGGAALYEAPMPSTVGMLPLVLKDSYGHTSVVTIQNTDPIQAAEAILRFTRSLENGPRLTVTLRIPPGEGRTMDLGKDSLAADLPAGFFGALTVESATPLAVQSFVDVEPSAKAVYGLIGQPVEWSDRTLYLPLFASRGPGVPFETLLVLANPTTTRATGLTITLRGTSGSCAGQTHVLRLGSVEPGSNALIYRWPAKADGSLFELPGMPRGCVGAATVTVDRGSALLATAALLWQGEITAGGYNAFGAHDVGKTVLLPLYRKEHTAARFSTTYHIMNVGDATAHVRVIVTAASGAAAPTLPELVIEPGHGHEFRPAEIAALAANQYGQARLDSDQPLAVVARDVSATTAQDLATYRGIAADAAPTARPPAPTPAPQPVAAPLILKSADLRAGPRPTPDGVAATPAVPPRAPYRVYLFAPGQ